MEKCDLSLRVSTALESSGPMLYTTASNILHCTCWYIAWMQLISHGTHSLKISTHCSWVNLKATWSLKVWSDWLCRKLPTSVHYAPQHPLTTLRHFTWPTTSWLSCCHSHHFHFVVIPLTVDCGIFRSEEISRLDLLHRWHPITVPHWNSLSSWERRIL